MSLPSPTLAASPWYKILYVQVIIGVVLGIAVGYFAPEFGKSLKPFGDAFVKLIKMMIAPIIFCTVVHGVASVGDLKSLGRVGTKSLIYFEIVSTLALLIGLVVVNVVEPGVGITPPGETYHADAKATADSQSISAKAKPLSMTDFLMNIIPSTIFGAFVSGDLLQVLFVSILFAFAILGLGESGKRALHWVDEAGKIFFGVMQIVIRAAPIGAFGAMGFTIGAFGIETLGKLFLLMAGFYLTAAVFVFAILGMITWWCGISIFRFLFYIKDELLLVLGTSSSESALPGLMHKMERLGCSKSTVGLVVPTGYSFNLDGTNIYMSMAAVFLAQATNTPLDLASQFKLLLIAMLTSKGASGVTGAGFVTLAATLNVTDIPIASLALLVGIDRFMSECRAITNFIGNGVAVLAISRWERELTASQLLKNIGPRG